MMIQEAGFGPKRWLTWNIVRTFRFDGQSRYHAEIKTSGTQHLPFSFERAKIHLQHSFRPRSEPRKAVPSLNVPTCALFENNLIQGELKLKTLNMEHFVQRQSGDSFWIKIRHPIFQEKLIHSKRINFNRTLLLKNCFSGSQKGDPPLNHSFVPKNGGATIWEKNRGNPSLLLQQGRIFVKVMVLVLIKGKAPSGISIHPGDFGRNAIFTVNWGTKGG